MHLLFFPCIYTCVFVLAFDKIFVTIFFTHKTQAKGKWLQMLLVQ